MPPKKGPHIDPQSSFTPESFDAELRSLAQQAKGETWGKLVWEQIGVYGKAASLLALASVYANVSQWALSPVYGSIPSSVWHTRVVMVAAFVGWAANLAIRRNLPVRPIVLLPLLAVYVPVVQFYLLKTSELLSVRWGPLVTEGLTLFPLMVVSVGCVADVLDAADLSRLPKWAADAAPGFGAYGFFAFVGALSAELLPKQMGKSLLQTRLGLELVLASLYTIMAPSRLLLYGIPALLHTAFMNTHVPTSMATNSLNATLNANGWSLVDRQESLTGYVSVVDGLEVGFRVMRCDHSLLGGEWTNLPKIRVAEPVYAVFVMLEAVRLVENTDKVPDDQAKALNM